MEIGAGGVGEREDEARLPQLGVVGERFARGRLRRRTDDRPGETLDRLFAVEVERFSHHQVDGPRTGLGRLVIERPVDARGFLRRGEEFLRQQLEPGVGHGAAVPRHEDELLAGKIAAEEPVDLRLRVFQRQPTLDVVAVVPFCLHRPHQHQWQQEQQDRHDCDAVPLIEVVAGVRHHAVDARGRGTGSSSGCAVRARNRTGQRRASPYRLPPPNRGSESIDRAQVFWSEELPSHAGSSQPAQSACLASEKMGKPGPFTLLCGGFSRVRPGARSGSGRRSARPGRRERKRSPGRSTSLCALRRRKAFGRSGHSGRGPAVGRRGAGAPPLRGRSRGG